MNRRAFFGGLFAILPAATCYKRIWKELAKTELPAEALLGCSGSYVCHFGDVTVGWQLLEKEATQDVAAGGLITIGERTWQWKTITTLSQSSVEADMHLG